MIMIIQTLRDHNNDNDNPNLARQSLNHSGAIAVAHHVVCCPTSIHKPENDNNDDNYERNNPCQGASVYFTLYNNNDDNNDNDDDDTDIVSPIDRPQKRNISNRGLNCCFS